MKQISGSMYDGFSVASITEKAENIERMFDMSEKQAITEEMHLGKEWFKQAHEQTLETLPDFMEHVLNDYFHDYGTICHAISACALAAVHAADSSPNGGITGFQAGFVMWDIIKQMNYVDNKCGLKITNYDYMLYPQYADRFEKTIDNHTWKVLQETAKKKIEQDSEIASQRVIEHWKSIAGGNVPFGYQIKGD